MLTDFACQETEGIWLGQASRKLPPEIQSRARKKLRMMNNARDLNDLRIPPNNRLEALKGNRKGQYSVRINEQWRICFCWQNGNVSQIEIVDYH